MINNKPFKFTNNDEKIIKKAFKYIIKNAQNKKTGAKAGTNKFADGSK